MLAVLAALPLPGCRVLAGDLKNGGVGIIGVLLVIALVATVAALVRRRSVG
jgi:hypothetical protein